MPARGAMRVVPFDPGHLAAIEPGPFEALVLEGLPADLLTRECPVPGPALTVLDAQGAPLGAFGLVPMWTGVAQAWVFASDSLRACPVVLHRTVARALGAGERLLRLHRVQISVHENFLTSRRWVERLGFACEGAMPGFGPNGDTYYRYARLRHVR